MTAPTTSRLTDLVFSRLPAYVKAADEDQDYSARRYLASLLDPQRATVELVDAADPDTSTTGTCELANPEAAQRAWLPWLGWMIGLDVSGVTESVQRRAISEASRLQRRGSRGAIIRAVQRTLTGSRSCRIYPNLSGSQPYLLTVVTITSQTPDPAESLLAAFQEKPAGMDVELQTTTGATYDELSIYFPTYDDLTDAFETYDDMASWVPPTP